MLPEHLLDWMPFIAAQTSIKHLCLAGACGVELREKMANAILKNAASLLKLELSELISTDHNLTARLFGELCHLNRLVLKGYRQPKLQNLAFLSASVETLVLENFNCKREELSLICERVPNVTTRYIKFGYEI